MAQFQVGDKVRCTRRGGTYFERGETYEVSATKRQFGRDLISVLGIDGFWEALRFVPDPKAKPEVTPEVAPKAGIPARFVVVAEDRSESLHPANRSAILRRAKPHGTKDAAIERAKELAEVYGKSFVVLQAVAEVSIEHVPATTKTVVKEV